MTKSEKIALLKAMIDDQNVSDDVLSAYLTLAGDKILNRMYPFKECESDRCFLQRGHKRL